MTASGARGGGHGIRGLAADPEVSLASIGELSTRIRAGTLSPIALLDQCLSRIETLNPRLNAFITVTADLAREQARAADAEIAAGHWRGPLHGVPVAVKDFYDTAGTRTTAAFERFANRVPHADADMVVRLRDAGAVLVGKTNMHTLGMGTTSLESHFGPVVNPWSARHVAGGSSGGSAAALAAGLCFATIDTDAVGSGRLPAAICGVTCLKPSFGVLSTTGVLAGEPVDPAILELSHASVMARSAADVGLAFEAVRQTSASSSARQSAISNTTSSGRRLGVATNFAATDEVRREFDAFIAQARRMAVEMHQVDVPFASASFDVSRIDQDRASIGARLFHDLDAIVLPTLAAPTPTVDEARSRGPQGVAADNTFFCNYFGLPAISVPAGRDRNGLPFGVQFVGPHGSDDRVLALAEEYQRVTRWKYEEPPLARTHG